MPDVRHLGGVRDTAVLDAIRDAVVGIDNEGVVTYWGRGAARLYGLSAAAALGRPLSEAYTYCWASPDEEGRAWAALERDGEWRGRNIHVLRSGEVRHVEAVVSVVSDDVGARVGLVAVIRDETARVEEERARRDAEEALRAGEERLRALVAAGSDVVYRMNADWTEMRQLHGRQFIADTDLPTRSWLDKYIHPDDQPRVKAAIDEAIRTKRTFALEHRVLRVDGTLGWTSSRAVPILDERGEITEWVGAASDITYRKQTEARIEESATEARQRAAELETVLDTVPAAVWIARDPRGDRIDANRLGAEMLRRRPGENVSITSPDEDRPRNFTVERDGHAIPEDELPMQVAARAGVEVRNAEFDLHFEDGDVRHLVGNAAPLRDEHGATKGAVGAFIDITERSRAEERLRASELRLRMALDAARMAAWEYDPATLAVTLSENAQEVLELTRRHTDSDQGYAIIHPDDVERHRALVNGAIEARGSYVSTYRLAHSPGVWLEEHGRAVVDPAGAVRLVGVVQNVTDRKRAEEALREADRRKDEFLALLSHELRNPLGAIRNGLFLLEHAAPASDAAIRARTILHRQSEQLSRLVDDLLDVARIAGGKLELRRTRLDAREIVRRSLDDVSAAYEQRGVALLKTVTEPVWVEADAARLTQMIGNLLHNALKFTPPGGRVEVAVQAREGRCAISVRDTGVGIAPEDLARLFTRFAQAPRTRSQSQGGLGIGLSLVRELALLHGGSVRASSAGVGQGAEFTIELPLAPAASTVDLSPAVPQVAPGLSILIVEDNDDAAAVLADVLVLMGHRVRAVSTGQAAVQSITEDPPAVIVCDVGLPDMTGYDVIRAARSSPAGREVFAVALTGYAQPDDREVALAAGFDAHLPKPPSIEDLGALLAEVARRARPGDHRPWSRS